MFPIHVTDSAAPNPSHRTSTEELAAHAPLPLTPEAASAGQCSTSSARMGTGWDLAQMPRVAVQVRKGQGSASTLRRDDRPHRQQWHAGVLEHDHAYQWSRHVHPVYGISLIGLRAGLRYLVRPGKLDKPVGGLHCWPVQAMAT